MDECVYIRMDASLNGDMHVFIGAFELFYLLNASYVHAVNHHARAVKF